MDRNRRRKDIFLDILADICSGVLISLAVYGFAIPAEFPMAGISGISLIIYRLFYLPVGIVTILLNIPIAVGCYRILGRKFYLRSLKTILISSIIMDLTGPLWPVYEGELILAAISAGVLLGAGYGIVFMRNSSTGGMDFIIMAIRAKHPHLSIGRIALLLDVLVITVGGIFFGGLNAVIYGIILSYLNSVVLDKVIYGPNIGKLTMIVTDDPEKIVNLIEEISGRGATILKAVGGYSRADKGVVLCASNNKQMYAIQKRVMEEDEKAFVIVVESKDVIGEGFRIPDND